MLIAATILVTLLLFSAFVLLYRLNRVRDRMTLLSHVILPGDGSDPSDLDQLAKVRSLMYRQEVKRLTAKVRLGLDQLVDIRGSVAELVESVERGAGFCLQQKIAIAEQSQPQ